MHAKRHNPNGAKGPPAWQAWQRQAWQRHAAHRDATPTPTHDTPTPQVLVKGPAAGDALERTLFIARKEVEREARKAMGEAASDFYICSLSSRWAVV